MKAIALPYVVEQNEPSVPFKALIELPSEIEERDAFLINLFLEQVMSFEEEELKELITIRERTSDSDYGDIIVSYEGDAFLFITFVATYISGSGRYLLEDSSS